MSKNPSIVGSVVAGFPSPAEQYVEPPLDLNEFLVHRKEATFFMRVEGESMRDDGILSGDIIVVDRSLPIVNGKIVVMSVDGEFTVKRFRKTASGPALVPANSKFPVIYPKPGQEFLYFGTVVGVVRQVK